MADKREFSDRGVLREAGTTETILCRFAMDQSTGVVTILERSEGDQQWTDRKPKLLGKLFSR